MTRKLSDNAGYVRDLARKFIERADALGYKGRKADNAALGYFIGAAALAQMMGNEELYQHLGMISTLFISICGMSAVRELALLADA